MLERPPKSTVQEDIDAFKIAFTSEIQSINTEYPYWDKVKYIKTEDNKDNKSLWFALKFLRRLNPNKTNLEFGKYKFSFMITGEMFELLHYFDMNIGGSLTGEHLIPSENKNAYLISSIMEEAIASSQMEGAATTRKVAKDMLRKSEKPQNKGQQMILNNYLTINRIKEIAKTDFSIPQLLAIHRSMTENTLDDETDSGKIREHNNILIMNSITGDIAYTPPHYEELEELLADLEKFFNKNNKTFIHPIVKGIIIHFMLAYFHPFVDGNGRTARSLFYWYMLKNGYWLVEYLSISRIIYKTKTMYEKSFLYTEYDDNDLTYFVLYNLRTMKKAFEELKLYLKRKTEENSSIPLLINHTGINLRQAEILKLVMEKPDYILTIKEIENRFNVANQTARTDLEELVKSGYLSKIQINKVKRCYIKSDRFDNLVNKKLSS
jgi:Fic family protein